MTLPWDSKTFLASLTPPGTGAIATLALHGPDAWALIRNLFQPGSPNATAAVPPPLPEMPTPGRVWLGRLGDGALGGADEVVLSVKRTLPTPLIEIHCHGGREVIRLLEEVFAGRGVLVCSWQDLERQTAIDLSQAAALAALAEAPTARTAAILLDQYHGACSRALIAARAAAERNEAAEASRRLDELARHADVGRHLVTPWRVVLAGAPNVGKSSLVNALAGYQRSVVAPTPGTTRDVVTTQIAIAGWPVELADTAGWRDTASALEQQGIDRAHSAAEGADLCLWVLDAAAAPTWPTVMEERTHLVVNKIDLPATWDLAQASGAFHVSARTGAGLGDLVRALTEWLVPEPPPAGAPVPFTSLLADKVAAARQAWHAGNAREALDILANVWEERR